MYIDASVSKAKTYKMLKNCTSGEYSELHTVQMYQNGKKLLDISIPPYSSNQVSQVYSLSKTFTSIAVGMLYDDKKLSPDMRVCDILGYDDVGNKYVNEVTVHNLLTMGSGHNGDTMPAISKFSNGLKGFFDMEFEYKPGECFNYETGASYVLSAIVTKITGMSLFDFLNIRLFRPLEIDDCWWQKTAGDLNEGGVGLFVSTDDVAKIGIMLSCGGIYNGNRILSEEWINMMSQKQIDNSKNGTPNWSCGYGYHVWKNYKGGFRADGAYGQYCIVFPERKLALIAFTESANMETQITDIIDYMLDFAKSDDEKEVNLCELVNSAYAPMSSSKIQIDEMYKLDSNMQGFTFCEVKNDNGDLVLAFSNGETKQTIRLGNGYWAENEIFASAFKPTLIRMMPYMRAEVAKFSASYEMIAENTANVDIRYTNAPHHMIAQLKLDENFEFKLTLYKDVLMYEGSEKITGKKWQG